MALASKLYDEMHQSNLFSDTQEDKPKERIYPYRMRAKTTQIQICGISRHYGQPYQVIDKICEDIGATPYSIKNYRCIDRADAEMLIKVIERKYNNFND